ncbi:hypothetical protein SAMN05216206_0026 [Pseudomonas guineae]|uniref:Uncharacterized protein n=2 Tax=Pseudomonas guineae TaxID=425504 RepID=A0A1I3CED6_9PSED|nr:hypothetical protein SAMN05216206_0026 [Pseudomonas guineae]
MELSSAPMNRVPLAMEDVLLPCLQQVQLIFDSLLNDIRLLTADHLNALIDHAACGPEPQLSSSRT